MLVREGCASLFFGVFFTEFVLFGAAGFAGAPPYFSNSSCVELYFVAAFSLSIVLVLSACCSPR